MSAPNYSTGHRSCSLAASIGFTIVLADDAPSLNYVPDHYSPCETRRTGIDAGVDPFGYRTVRRRLISPLWSSVTIGIIKPTPRDIPMLVQRILDSQIANPPFSPGPEIGC